MQIEFDKLREVASYKRDPRRTGPATQPFEAFLTKEFSGQHLAEIFHENTKHRSYDDPHTAMSIQRFLNDESMIYTTAVLEPDYPGYERIDLPEPEPLEVRLDTALSSRRSRREFTGEGVSKATLGTLLGHSFGVTGDRTVAASDEGEELEQEFRAYPSGGGLYPVEFYVFLPIGGEDIDPGAYYYAPNSHALRVLERGDEGFEERVRDLFLADSEAVEDAGAIVCQTANFWRSMAKYGDRGYRLVLQESGHAGQNLLLAAEATGLGAVPYDGFDGTAIEEFLEIDGVDESAIYSILVGHPQGETDE